MILEDDAILIDGFKNKLAKLLDEIKYVKWDALYLNENCMKWFNKDACNGELYTKNTMRPKNIGYGLYGYVIKRECVMKCNDVKPFIEPLDTYMINKAAKNYNFIILRSKDVLVKVDKSFVSDTLKIK